MKIVAFFLFVVTFVSAKLSLIDKVRPLLEDIELIPGLLQEDGGGGSSLREVLGRPDAVQLDIVEARIRKDLGQFLRQFLEEILKGFQEVGEQAQDGFKEQLEQFSHQPPTNKSVAEFVDQMYVIYHVQQRIGRIVADALGKRSIMTGLTNLSMGGVNDWLETTKEALAEFGDLTPDTPDVLQDWVKGVLPNVTEAIKPLRKQIKAVAVEYLKNNWNEVSVNLVKQALDVFIPFEGEIRADIMKKLIELAKKLNVVPSEKDEL